jgi:hypothetical protein
VAQSQEESKESNAKPEAPANAPGEAYKRYRRRPVEYCRKQLNVKLTPDQEKIARLLVQPPYKVLVRAGHNVGHSDAARTDVQYSMLWDRGRRALVPELVVLHLESEDAATGANWSGRTTRPFGRPAGLPATTCPLPCS